VDQGDEFEVLVTARDLRLGGDETNRGVESVYLDMLFDRALVEPVLDPTNPLGFDITFHPFYDDFQEGFPNVPATGQIDEVGAIWSPPEPGPGETAPKPGLGDVNVFTVVMRAIASTTAGESLQIIADPAGTRAVAISDEDPLVPNPIPLNDAQVFHRASGDVTIFGAGEGLYVNRVNPLDVTQDGAVAPNDIITVINSLNVGGSRSLKTPSTLSVQGMVDVNMDSMLSPLDALMVINYINSRQRTHFIASGGEGEATPSAASGTATDATLAAALSLEESDVGATSGAPTSVTPVQLSDSTPATGASTASSGTSATASDSATTSTAGSTEVDAAAADDLFAELATARTTLRQRYRR
jgi:hypothetical protein